MAASESQPTHLASVALDRAREHLAQRLRQVGGGDRSAFQDLYNLTSAKLFGICLRILPDKAEAEDALQDTYISIWQKASAFDALRGSPITWLSMIARSRSIDRLRSRRPIAQAPLLFAENVADDGELADRTIERSQEAGRLGHCLDELAGQDAVMIRTAFLEGSTYPELAARAGQPLGTVKSRIRRALLKLRECLSG